MDRRIGRTIYSILIYATTRHSANFGRPRSQPHHRRTWHVYKSVRARTHTRAHDHTHTLTYASIFIFVCAMYSALCTMYIYVIGTIYVYPCAMYYVYLCDSMIFYVLCTLRMERTLYIISDHFFACLFFMCKFMVVLSDNAVTIYASFWAQLSRQVFRKPRAAMPEPSSSAASAFPPQRVLQPKAPTPFPQSSRGATGPA